VISTGGNKLADQLLDLGKMITIKPQI